MPDETPETEAADAELSDLLDTPAPTEEQPAEEPHDTPAEDQGSEAPSDQNAEQLREGKDGAVAVAGAGRPEAPKSAAAEQPKSPNELRLAELDTLIDADDFDAYSREGKRILKERGDVAAEVRVEPLRQQIHNATIWTNLSETHELPVKELRAAWDDVKKKYPGKSQDVLDFAFEQRIEAMKSEKSEKSEKPKPAPTAAAAPAPTPQPKPRATIAPKPGAVAPNQPSAHRPPVPAADAGAGFDRTVSREELASFPN
jgi:hypothetical protein